MKLFYSILVSVLLVSCSDSNSRKPSVPVKDTLEIWADTSLGVIINQQKKAFENSYNNPFLDIHYTYESNITESLMRDKVNCAVMQRKLTRNEAEYIKDKEDFLPKQYILAYDAFVFIVNKENEIDALSKSEIRNYFTGVGNTGKFQLVFESNKCQAIPYFQACFNLSTAQISTGFTKSNLDELIKFLNQDAGSIGIIPFSYISDLESVATLELLKNLKVLSVSYTDSLQRKVVVNPSQESITTREYPFITPIVLMNCNMEKKSGTTFVNYILKPSAQRLFLKCGIVPAVFPGREVKVNSN